jgi:hypothetical protein
MIKLKNLSRKLRRLEASLKKDGKKLSKLKRKVEAALKADSTKVEVTSPAPAQKVSKTARAMAPKKRSGLTAAGRERLSAAMKARWAAKKAGAVTNAGFREELHPTEVFQPSDAGGSSADR